jgi:hypothetical protein
VRTRTSVNAQRSDDDKTCEKGCVISYCQVETEQDPQAVIEYLPWIEAILSQSVANTLTEVKIRK